MSNNSTNKRPRPRGRGPNGLITVFIAALCVLQLTAFAVPALADDTAATTALTTDASGQPVTPAADAQTPGAADSIFSAMLYVQARGTDGITTRQPLTSQTQALQSPGSVQLVISCKLTAATVAANANGSLYLFALDPYQTADQIKTAEPAADPVAVDPNTYAYTFYLPYDTTDLKTADLFKKYVVGTGADGSYKPLTNCEYIGNAEGLASSGDLPLVGVTKKGLQVQMLADAENLGIGYAYVTMSVNDFMSAGPTPTSDPYQFDGQTYYFNTDKIKQYDQQIKPLSDQGVVVVADLTLSYEPPASATPAGTSSAGTDAPATDTGGDPADAQAPAQTPAQIMTYPGADPTAQLCGINVTDPDGTRYFEALMSYIADRYCASTDIGGGHISDIILGQQIPRGTLYNNCGGAGFGDYMQNYINSLRIADTAVRSRSAGTRVYIPLDNYWNTTSTVGAVSAVEYPAKQVLDSAYALSAAEGNFPWNVAMRLYNADPGGAAFWSESAPTEDVNTPIITMKNIDVLENYMNGDMAQYQPSQGNRRILISEAGFSSASGSDSDAQMQAAAFAYAYYKAAFDDTIEGFIYYSQLDDPADSPYFFGLWTPSGAQKYIYNVFRDIDTANSQQATAFALPLIGVTGWNQVINNFDANTLAKRNVIQQIGLPSMNTGGYTASQLFRFSSGSVAGFTGLINVDSVSAVNTSGTKYALQAAYTDSVPAEYKGVYQTFATPLDLSGASYLRVSLNVGAPAEVEKMDVMLCLYSGRTDVYQGTATIAASTPETLYFKLSDWDGTLRKNITQVRIWTRDSDIASAQSGGQYTLAISDISALAPKSGSPLPFLFAFVIIALAIVIIFFGVMWIREQLQRRRYAPAGVYPGGSSNPLINGGNGGARPAGAAGAVAGVLAGVSALIYNLRYRRKQTGDGNGNAAQKYGHSPYSQRPDNIPQMSQQEYLERQYQRREQRPQAQYPPQDPQPRGSRQQYNNQRQQRRPDPRQPQQPAPAHRSPQPQRPPRPVTRVTEQGSGMGSGGQQYREYSFDTQQASRPPVNPDQTRNRPAQRPASQNQNGATYPRQARRQPQQGMDQQRRQNPPPARQTRPQPTQRQGYQGYPRRGNPTPPPDNRVSVMKPSGGALTQSLNDNPPPKDRDRWQ